jgi:hypothetical protein
MLQAYPRVELKTSFKNTTRATVISGRK